MSKLEINLSKDIDEDLKYYDETKFIKNRKVDEDSIYLTYSECSNIINQFNYDSVTSDNFVKAIDFIIAYLYKCQSFEEVVDITARNNALAPTKMTKTEIEKALGYPIEIVKENK